jgi:hypothetical protein
MLRQDTTRITIFSRSQYAGRRANMTLDRIQRIKDVFEHERTSMPIARSAADIPISYEAITPEWLTSVLCSSNLEAKVLRFKLGEDDNGTSNRRRIFLSYNAAGEAAALPRSVFCKATHDLANRLILSNGGTMSEVIFYNKVRPLVRFDAPRAILARYDPVSFVSIIMLYDMADEVTFCTQDTVVSEEMARSQLALLGSLHGAFHESPAFAGSLSDVLTWQGRFKSLIARHRLRECCAAGFTAAEAFIPPNLFARADDIWPATLRSIDRHDELPKTLNHGDVHLKNWYVRGRSSMGLSDWQTLCRGHWSRDLAYAISTALDVDDRRSWERELIRYYLDRQHEAGAPRVTFDDAWKNYRQQLFGALAWWTQTMSPSEEMPDMQPRATTVKFIRRITQAIEDLDSLASFD